MSEKIIPLEKLGNIETVKVYNQAYIDKQQKRIEELELENTELKEQIKNMQEKLKADLIANLKEKMQYSTSPSCTKGMELFIRSIEKWKMKEND